MQDTPEPISLPDNQRDDLSECLDREMSRLPDKYRIPVVMCDLEGMTHREAASQLGWPVGTVSSRLLRARAMLARRLSRSGLPLSVGSLDVLRAQDVASASMPTWLVGSTAQAATLIAAGGAVAAGMVPAEVAALTGDVVKMMLLSKFKIATAIFLVFSALVAGGTGLAFRAQANEPGQDDNDNIQRLIDEKKEELRQLVAKQKENGEGRRNDASEVRRSSRPAASIPQKSPPIERREARTLVVPAPRPGSQMEILFTIPGKHSERYIPEIIDQDRLRVKVEERGENGSKDYEVICSTIEVKAFAEPSQRDTHSGADALLPAPERPATNEKRP